MFCKCTECENRGGFSCPRQLELQNCTTPHYLDTLNSNPFHSPPLPTLEGMGFSSTAGGYIDQPERDERAFIKKHLKRFPKNTVKAGFIISNECRQLIKDKKFILFLRSPRKTEDEKTTTYFEACIQLDNIGDLGRILFSDGQLVICDINSSEVLEVIGL